MATLILCMNCRTGNCEYHMHGNIAPGLLGGWRCPCQHTDAERAQHKAEWEQRFRDMLSSKTENGF